MTPNGSLRAKHVVLAMNAWAIRFAEIRKALIAVTSDIVATPPIPELSIVNIRPRLKSGTYGRKPPGSGTRSKLES